LVMALRRAVVVRRRVALVRSMVLMERLSMAVVHFVCLL
jgi:hypothetical protein